LRYLIPEHIARRLYYDFRIDLEGRLSSCVIPKGPSLNPSDKRIAVHVEDHPMEDADRHVRNWELLLRFPWHGGSSPALHSDPFTMCNIGERLSQLTTDPWEELFKVYQYPTSEMKNRIGLGVPQS
jgi:hypothetical protein